MKGLYNVKLGKYMTLFQNIFIKILVFLSAVSAGSQKGDILDVVFLQIGRIIDYTIGLIAHKV